MCMEDSRDGCVTDPWPSHCGHKGFLRICCHVSISEFFACVQAHQVLPGVFLAPLRDSIFGALRLLAIGRRQLH